MLTIYRLTAASQEPKPAMAVVSWHLGTAANDGTPGDPEGRG